MRGDGPKPDRVKTLDKEISHLMGESVNKFDTRRPSSAVSVTTTELRNKGAGSMVASFRLLDPWAHLLATKFLESGRAFLSNWANPRRDIIIAFVMH